MKQWLVLIWLMALCGGAMAQQVDPKAKSQAQGFVKKMAQIESKAKGIKPMHIPMASRTRQQDKEITRRIEFLDQLQNQECLPLLREVGSAQLPAPLTPVRQAAEALDDWMTAKLSLQNAGVNNPSLDLLKKQEPQKHQDYLEAYKKAQDCLK